VIFSPKTVHGRVRLTPSRPRWSLNHTRGRQNCRHVEEKQLANHISFPSEDSVVSFLAYLWPETRTYFRRHATFLKIDPRRLIGSEFTDAVSWELDGFQCFPNYRKAWVLNTCMPIYQPSPVSLSPNFSTCDVAVQSLEK
jgi:hypothetical protein